MANYLGGFMGGSPDYNGNPGILGLYQFVQSGYDAGKAKAQNQALAQLSQKAYTDTGDAQKQDIAQAIGIDPQTGYALAEKAQAQQATQQAQQLQLLQRYGKASSAILQAKQSGDDAAAEGIYQGMLPELRMHAAQTGQPEPPPTLDASVMPTVYKLASMYASIPQAQKGVVIAAGGELVNPTTGAKMASVPNKGQVVSGYYFDPNTGTASPIPIKGTQNGMGMGATVPSAGAGAAPQAPNVGAPAPSSIIDGPVPSGTQVSSATGPDGARVAFAFAPDTPDAVQSQTGAMAGIPQGSPQAPVQGQTLAQVIAAGKQHAQSNSGAVPSGYEWAPDHTRLIPIPGGPSDPDANPFDLTPDAITNSAWNVIMDGKMPSLGRSKQALGVRAQIMNQVAKIAKQAGVSPADLATQHGRTKALQASLQNLQKQSDVMEKSEETFLNNAHIMLNLSDQVSRTGVPAFNQFLLHVKTDYRGDPNSAAFLSARNLVAQEYAKIASNATGAAGSSDTAQAHALSLINTAQTPEQLQKVIETLTQDIDGQKRATEQQLLNIAGRMQQLGTANQYPGHAFTAPPGQQPAPAAAGASSGVDSLLSKYGIQ